MTDKMTQAANLKMMASFEGSAKTQIPKCAAILGASDVNGQVALHLVIDQNLSPETIIRTLRAIADNLENTESGRVTGDEDFPPSKGTC